MTTPKGDCRLQNGLNKNKMKALKWAQKTYLKFPIDPVKENFVRPNVKGAIFSAASPTPLKETSLACFSSDVFKNILQLDPAMSSDKTLIDILSGNKEVPGSTPLAHRYGGHQFGNWAGQLGDGRAHLIGECTDRAGERWELQLKGSGKTPYSRFADGRAVVRSSVREFLCSEAMHHLGVPTSRAGALVVSDDTLLRDPFYDGRPRRERAAVLLRLAPCWFRFGSLQMLAADGDEGSLRLLADFVCERYYTEAAAREGGRRYSRLVEDVGRRTARLIAAWESVGFTHGVMNTDNMSLLGLTIDYGPFGFLDRYDPNFISNSSDSYGVYRFAHQARVGQWNLCRLWEALMPVIPEEEHGHIERVLQIYVQEYETHRGELLSRKLGLNRSTSAVKLADRLLELMLAARADFTMTFRQLGDVSLEALKAGRVEGLWALPSLTAADGWSDWLTDLRAEMDRQGLSDAQRRATAAGANPRYILRNWLAHEAAEAAERGEFEPLRQLHTVLSRPFTEQPAAEEAGYAKPPPDWACTLRVSCSS
ncbi:protein adenylyltransferase SelO-like isoform X1 [Amphibalanus amphitrite]|uniref:protein adenylyltransferase SelO-like isoform X1 n=1 Tax=Amphibalanus amphitrite TaxID=1232801 RepID=UPI001C913FBF|nr:protein adenylyltransferase SelO-like isoform X1 [Amphibalanus amphitrite]